MASTIPHCENVVKKFKNVTLSIIAYEQSNALPACFSDIQKTNKRIKYFCSYINIFAVPQTAAVCVREADQHHAGDPRAAGVPQPPRQEELPHPLAAAQHQEQAPQPEEVHLRCPRGESLLIRDVDENTSNASSSSQRP